MATSEAFFVASSLQHDAVELSGYFCLLVGIKMAVGLHGGLDAFMAQSLGDQQRRKSHFHQETCMTVPEIMYPDALDAGCTAAVFHLPVKEGFAAGKQAAVRLQAVHLSHVFLQTRQKPFRNGDDAVAADGLG